MARQSLLEFQTRLAERLANPHPESTATQLGFEAAGRRWLVALADLAEVVNGAQITPVPWARRWFLGLTNIRGVLYGCTDLAAFMEQAAVLEASAATLLVAHPRFGVNAALRVARSLGLFNPIGFTASFVPPDKHEWILGVNQDAQGHQWWVLDVGRLLTSDRFLDAADRERFARR